MEGLGDGGEIGSAVVVLVGVGVGEGGGVRTSMRRRIGPRERRRSRLFSAGCCRRRCWLFAGARSRRLGDGASFRGMVSIWWLEAFGHELE